MRRGGEHLGRSTLAFVELAERSSDVSSAGDIRAVPAYRHALVRRSVGRAGRRDHPVDWGRNAPSRVMFRQPIGPGANANVFIRE